MFISLVQARDGSCLGHEGPNRDVDDWTGLCFRGRTDRRVEILMGEEEQCDG